VTIVIGITASTDRIIYSSQIRLATIDGTLENITGEFRECGQVILRGVRNIVAWGNDVAYESLIGVKIAAGAGVSRVIGVGSRWEALKLEGNEHLKLVGIVNGAAVMDMPVSIGAGSDGLSLQGCGVVVRPHLPRDNVQEIVGFNGDGDRVGAIGVRTGPLAITPLVEFCTAPRSIWRIDLAWNIKVASIRIT
jgi:hypothetical protein